MLLKIAKSWNLTILNLLYRINRVKDQHLSKPEDQLHNKIEDQIHLYVIRELVRICLNILVIINIIKDHIHLYVIKDRNQLFYMNKNLIKNKK